MRQISISELKREPVQTLLEKGSCEITSEGEAIGILVFPETGWVRDNVYHFAELGLSSRARDKEDSQREE